MLQRVGTVLLFIAVVGGAIVFRPARPAFAACDLSPWPGQQGGVQYLNRFNVTGSSGACALGPAQAIRLGRDGVPTAPDLSGPIAIDADVDVDGGTSLTLEAGVTVSASCCLLAINSGGALNAKGTAGPSGSVTFTSAKANPAPGDWGPIVFYAGSSGNLNYAKILYGGGVLAVASQPTISNSTIDHSASDGVHVGQNSCNGFVGNPTLTNDQFTNNAGWAVWYECPPATFGQDHNLSASGNGHNDILFNPGRISGAWDIPSDQGLPITFSTGGYYVSAGAGLTLEAGTTLLMDKSAIQFDGSVDSRAGGMINANGTADHPVTITSANANPAPGDWGPIFFASGIQRASGTLSYAKILNGGASCI
ncbi:MAG: hypothetical protein ACR2PL_23800, partial [Dehalococcoidia bacterium]